MTTHVKLGVTFNLNNKTISLKPTEAINEIAEKGIELKLPPEERIELGTAGEGMDSILTQLGSIYRTVKPTSPEDGKEYIVDKLPTFDPLTKAYQKVVTAHLNIEKFHAQIPGSKTMKAGTTTQETEIKYTIGLSATWPPEEQNSPDTGLTLTGIYFEVSNEEVPAAN